MDQFVVDYLKSGKAWLLIGSGPSIAAGHPSWESFTEGIIRIVHLETEGKANRKIQKGMERRDYPAVLEECKRILGGSRLLSLLQLTFSKRKNLNQIYKLIASWPIPVYLTTNYDDEITYNLAEFGEAYITYSNSEDNFSVLTPDFKGAVIKLHGDYKSENGLILTRSDYKAIQEDSYWKYWRTKLTSIFQMIPIIIIGHSLYDPNIRHILEAAKKGAGVNQPICWIAPDISFDQRKEYLEKYRIRVIPYSNQSGDHSNLIRLIEDISNFIYPRLSIPVQKQITDISVSPLGESAAAPGFFVYNKLTAADPIEEKRIDIILSIIESAIPELKKIDNFTLQDALEKTGWPIDFPIDERLSLALTEKAIEIGILERINDDDFKLGEFAEEKVKKNQKEFSHLKERFIKSLLLRIKRKYSSLSPADALTISTDIEKSLIGYFREGGLSLATTLFSNRASRPVVPSSIIKFITDSSTRYDDLLKRQAFCTISVDAFVQSESAERDYLGRIAQGFFAFHALGVFGDVALERLSHAKNTVWIIDSNVQISLLSFQSYSNTLFRDVFNKLKQLNVRTFTTEKLFYEAWEHYHFANKLIEKEGPSSASVLAASTGDVPFYRSNLFLEGFIFWQAVGNPCDWNLYLFEIFGQRNPTIKDMRRTLEFFGIEIVEFQNWPGFEQNNFDECKNYVETITGKLLESLLERDVDMYRDPFKKATPEAEVLTIINKERNGTYYILSEEGKYSTSWFISDTSILNIINRSKITWQPDDFSKFIFTLTPNTDNNMADRAFDLISISIAHSGLSLINDQVISVVFGGVIDQASLNIIEQRQLYEENLSTKYAEPPERVLERIPPRYKIIAGIQLAEETAQIESERRLKAEKEKEEAEKKLKSLKKDISKLENYRKKLEKRAAKSKPKKGKNKVSKRKKGKK